MDYYSIDPLADITHQRESMAGSFPVQIEYRRIKTSFPHPYKLWGVKAKKQMSDLQLLKVPPAYRNQLVLNSESYNRIADVHLVKGPTGRYKIDSYDPLAKHVFRSFILGTPRCQERCRMS